MEEYIRTRNAFRTAVRACSPRIGLAVILLAVLFLSFCGGSDKSRTLASIKKVDEHPLFVMHYFGDYDLSPYLPDELRSAHVQSAHLHVAQPAWACTCFSALNPNGELLFGRNFDWYDHPALLLFTAPPGRYASASMVDVSYLGCSGGELSASEREALLQAPYLPFDGMNERGLAVGMMAVPHAESGNDAQKLTVDSLLAIRIMLDYAANVDEALVLLQNYNIDFGGGPPLHYLISDATRDSAVVEYVDGEMRVLRNSEPWQVSTNFVISEVNPQGSQSPCWRYTKAYATLEQASGSLSQAEAMALLADVSQPQGDTPTRWSVVYNMRTGSLEVTMGRKYEQAKDFKLQMHHD